MRVVHGSDLQRACVLPPFASSVASAPAEAEHTGAVCPFRGHTDGDSFIARLKGRAEPTETNEQTEKKSSLAAELHAEPINPRNMMPDISNEPHQDGDDLTLSTKRRLSTIPKTGEDATWVYPSPLQFHRAMKKKNKEPPPADAMETTVYVHDVVNERTWKNILHWENSFHKDCEKPTLSRFVGRSSDYTPTARLRQYFSYMGLPFDRHDWYIDRCGETVRYVVDYYDDPQASDNIQVFIDARPAWFDSWQNFSDNVRRVFSSIFA